jgi:hypothetical protein
MEENSLIIVIGMLDLIVGIAVFISSLIGFVWLGRREIDTSIKNSIGATVGKIKTNLKIVCDYLIGKEGFNHSEIESYSPRKLTERGEDFIKNHNFEEIFKNHKSDFFNYIDSENPRQKHDVENASIKSIYLLSNQDYMRFLKTFFYNNPARNLPNTAPTLGVYVRDRYLEEHPKITD